MNPGEAHNLVLKEGVRGIKKSLSTTERRREREKEELAMMDVWRSLHEQEVEGVLCQYNYKIGFYGLPNCHTHTSIDAWRDSITPTIGKFEWVCLHCGKVKLRENFPYYRRYVCLSCMQKVHGRARTLSEHELLAKQGYWNVYKNKEFFADEPWRDA